MPAGMLPTPVTSHGHGADKPFPALSFLTGRSNRPIRLLLLVVVTLLCLGYTFQSFTHRSPLSSNKLDSIEYSPSSSDHPGSNNLSGGSGEAYKSPPFVADRLDLSQNARDIRATLNFVTQFPERQLPAAVLDEGADVANVLRDEARAAGESDWDEGTRELPLVVFSKTYCPFSKRAKELLNLLHLSPPPFVVEADLRGDTSLLKSLLTKLTNHSTFPNIFIGGHSIGGSDDLQRLQEEGKLREMLRAVGVGRAGPAGKRR